MVDNNRAQTVFATTALSLGDWLLALLVAASILVIEEVRKLVLATRIRRE
jgi:hypothetical protein